MSKKASSITSRNSDSNALNGLKKRQNHLICNWLPLSSFHHQFLESHKDSLLRNPLLETTPGPLAVGFLGLIPEFRRNRRELRYRGRRVLSAWKRPRLAKREFNPLRLPTLPEHDEPVQRGSEGEMPRPAERKPGGC